MIRHLLAVLALALVFIATGPREAHAFSIGDFAGGAQDVFADTLSDMSGTVTNGVGRVWDGVSGVASDAITFVDNSWVAEGARTAVDGVIGAGDALVTGVGNAGRWAIYGAQEVDADQINAKLNMDCWSCTFVGRFAEMADAFSREVYLQISIWLGPIVSLVFAIWLLLQATKLFFPEHTDRPSNVLRTLVTRGLLFLIVAFLLTGPQTYGGRASGIIEGRQMFFDWGPYALIDAAADVSNEIIVGSGKFGANQAIYDGGGGNPSFADPGENSTCGQYDTLRDDANDASKGSLAGLGGDEGRSFLPQETIQVMTCQIAHMQRVNNVGRLAGTYILAEMGGDSASFAAKAVTLDFSGIFSSIAAVLAGLILLIVFIIALVAYPFFFIDILVRIFFIAAFAPIFILMALFKPSQQFSVAAAKALFAGVVTIIVTAMIYALTATMMSYVPLMIENPAGGTFKTFTEVLVALSNAKMIVNLSFESTAYWYMLMAGLFSLFLMRKSATLISGIFSTHGADQNMGIAAQNFAKSVGTKAIMGATVAMVAPVAAGGMVGGKAGMSKLKSMMNPRNLEG
ncbi:hypothetical protein CKO28_02495 [Rhodovibrio sodomensis]|uniref:TrbL/VirB6 plasmid conjugal transfer protein n=1 Tax=Rhodovibrio sodomensis TaxID=1088 RepID=A0ABS1DAC8_9PROT|nr:hypothetical protein [Rhodovibrio sodomensis]MBK1666911.1 hypothetical protein [Rhodovibrio sodomensis]